MSPGMIRYTCWSKYQTSISVHRYNTAKDVWYFDAHTEVPPEIETLMKVKRRLASESGIVAVFTEGGQIIDEPA